MSMSLSLLSLPLFKEVIGNILISGIFNSDNTSGPKRALDFVGHFLNPVI